MRDCGETTACPEHGVCDLQLNRLTIAPVQTTTGSRVPEWRCWADSTSGATVRQMTLEELAGARKGTSLEDPRTPCASCVEVEHDLDPGSALQRRGSDEKDGRGGGRTPSTTMPCFGTRPSSGPPVCSPAWYAIIASTCARVRATHTPHTSNSMCFDRSMSVRQCAGSSTHAFAHPFGCVCSTHRVPYSSSSRSSAHGMYCSGSSRGTCPMNTTFWSPRAHARCVQHLLVYFATSGASGGGYATYCGRRSGGSCFRGTLWAFAGTSPTLLPPRNIQAADALTCAKVLD
eukprot:CAMPEP_0174850960 /NCGR_PEP_ID=MMETSP1114-20130205/21231_1 /TAXON_ID=312471 /ORGANISM="Neobodo designis, Strain CCAP 1951/1" /LENGTH=287 /DNA_ID=CAMNT_0016085457 /DNA_START=168 /DNA_END=1031 /DNA_ORIENTATION=+